MNEEFKTWDIIYKWRKTIYTFQPKRKEYFFCFLMIKFSYYFTNSLLVLHR